MKPTFTIIGREKQFPITDCNYHSVALDSFDGRCVTIPSPSFRSISRDYFENEERNSFLGEAAVFATLMVSAAVPLVSGACAIMQLLRTFGSL